MAEQKTVKAVTIRDPYALKLLSKRAANEKRSATSAAVITIIELLSKKPKHNFRDDIIEKQSKVKSQAGTLNCGKESNKES